MEENKKQSEISATGEIWVHEFTIESAERFRNQLLMQSMIDPQCPIVIHINSYGGLVDSLASMLETMDELSNPMITVCHGTAMSCGAVLLSHGDIRFIGHHSRVMIHEVSGGSGGDVHDVHADAIELKRMNEKFMGLLAKNCGIKGGYQALRKLIKNQDGRDYYMDAEQALKFGVVDKIGLPKLSKMNLYQVDLMSIEETPMSAKVKKRNKKTDSK